MRFSSVFGRDRASLPRDCQGFSVVEILIVFTLIAIALLPLTNVQFESKHQLNEASCQAQALRVAQEQIERAKMAGFGNAVADTAQVGRYRYSTQIIPDPGNPFLEEIRTTVYWEYNNETRNLSISSKQAPR